MVSLYRCIVVAQTALIKHSVNTYEEAFLCDASMSASLVVICVKLQSRRSGPLRNSRSDQNQHV